MRARAANQHYAGSKCVVTDTNLSIVALCAHWPGTSDGKPSTEDRIKERLPPGTRCPAITLGLRLLECIVNGNWKGRVRLLSQAVHGLRHTIHKEESCILLTVMAVCERD